MPPLATWYRGHDALTAFLKRGPLSGEWRWRHLPARANGQLAIGAYTWHSDEQCYRSFALDVLTLRGAEIAEVTAFITQHRKTLVEFSFEDVSLRNGEGVILVKERP